MAEKSNEVDYELYDISSGGIYVIRVHPKEAEALQVNKEKRFRILRNLKASGKKPDKVWDSLLEDSVQSTQLTFPKKKKVSVCGWNDDAQWALMHELVPHRHKLRTQRYAVQIWEEVSKKLSAHNLLDTYSAEQVAEKVRLMKRTLKDVKNGKRKTDWEFTDVMMYIFEKPIEEVEEATAKDLTHVGSYDSYVNGMPTGLCSSTIENSPDALGHMAVILPEHQSVQAKSVPAKWSDQGTTSSGDTLYIEAAEDFATLSCDKSPAGTNGSGETFALFVGSEFSSFQADKAESNVRRELFDVSAHSGSRATSDDDVIVLSDTDGCFTLPEIKQEPNNNNSDFNVDGSQGNLDVSFSEMNIEDTLPSTQRKIIVSCQKTPKGRSSPKKGQGSTWVLHGDVPCRSPKENTQLRTPVKKKSKSTSERVVPSSPATTPKRKPAKKNLVWPAPLENDFLMECVARKARIQQFPDTPLQVWKDVAAALHGKGHIEITWDLCRSKFDQMNNFFVNTALKLGGKIGNTKWSHYDNFLEIHDIPQDTEIPENIELNVNHESDETGGRKIWTDRLITLLLDCYKLMKEKFSGTKSHVRHSILYAHISTIMNQFEGVEVSGKQCERQMNHLRSQFFEEYDKQRGTGRAPSQWRFFKAMREIFDGDANLDAPFAATVGNAGVYYTARGEEQAIIERNTRTRPPSDKNKEAKRDPKEKLNKKGYKFWPREIQEKQYEQRQALVDEVRLLRLDFERRSAQRMELLKEIVQKM